MSLVAYPKQDGVISSVVIIKSANTPKYVNLPGVLINPVIADEVMSAPQTHRKMGNGTVIMKTAEEIELMDTRTQAEKRNEAYTNECDPYIPVLLSYQLENDSRFAAIKAEWEAKRLAIQNLYPDA